MKSLLRLAVASVGGLALVGLLHLPALRPLLRWVPAGLAPASACPVGGTAATAQEREATRRWALAPRLSGGLAPPLQLFGLTLGTTGRAEAQEVLAAAGADCRPDTSGMVLTCQVPAAALPSWKLAGTLFVRFDDADRLVALGVMSSAPGAPEGAQAKEVASADVARQWGLPGTTSGQAAQEAQLEAWADGWRFANATAEVKALRFGDGFRFSAEAQWLPGVASSR